MVVDFGTAGKLVKYVSLQAVAQLEADKCVPNRRFLGQCYNMRLMVNI